MKKIKDLQEKVCEYLKTEPNEIFSKLVKKIYFNTKLAFFTTIIIGLLVHCAIYARDIHDPDCLLVGVSYGKCTWEVSLREMDVSSN